MKVALLFLARDNIHTEGIWTAFFASAAELSLKHSVPPTAPLHHPILPTKYAASFCEARTSWDIEQLKQWEQGALILLLIAVIPTAYAFTGKENTLTFP